MPNEFVIQAPTNSLQLNDQGQAEFIYNVYNASGRPLRAQAIIHTTPPGEEGWFNFAPVERDFPISHSEQYELHITVPPTALPGAYTFTLDMLWEGAGEPEQRTVTGQSVTFEVPGLQLKVIPWWVYALAGGGLLVIIAIVVVAAILSNRTVTVPNLAMMTADQAKTALERAGLKLKEPVSEDYSGMVPTGLVISFEPGLDEKVKPGTEVSVTISQGTEKFMVPELANLAQDEARAKLESACSPQPCFNVTVQREDSQAVGIDQAIRTIPAAGEKLARGAKVTLVISNGFTYTFNNRVAVSDVFTYPSTILCNGTPPIWQLEPLPYKLLAPPTSQSLPPVLELVYTTQVEEEWKGAGSEANNVGSLYRPVVPSGYYALGHYVQSGYEKPSKGMFVARELAPGILAQPIDYNLVWAIQGEVAGYMNGSIWEPVPPPDYVCLGFVGQLDYQKPGLDEIRCVRQDLVTQGTVGSMIWYDYDRHVGADTANFTSWNITSLNEDGISVGTFIGQRSITPPNFPVYVLKNNLIKKKNLPKEWESFLNFCPDFTTGTDLILANDIQEGVFYPGMIAIKFNLSEIETAGSMEQATLSLYLKSLIKGTNDMDVYVSAATSDWDENSGPPQCSTARTQVVKVSQAGTVYNFDLQELLATHSSDIANYGLCVLSGDEELVIFGSSEDIATQRPRLSGIFRK